MAKQTRVLRLSFCLSGFYNTKTYNKQGWKTYRRVQSMKVQEGREVREKKKIFSH
jgi:hypothetical protein